MPLSSNIRSSATSVKALELTQLVYEPQVKGKGHTSVDTRISNIVNTFQVSRENK
jgi:hypothetical protein